ncbi:MAG: hypothetical protein ACD_39C01219G0001 [uncultured bacterium]|nr:MAG: hypothetical protein ACD_39C01219G0001 [uncultured bacterium]
MKFKTGLTRVLAMMLLFAFFLFFSRAASAENSEIDILEIRRIVSDQNEPGNSQQASVTIIVRSRFRRVEVSPLGSQFQPRRIMDQRTKCLTIQKQLLEKVKQYNSNHNNKMTDLDIELLLAEEDSPDELQCPLTKTASYGGHGLDTDKPHIFCWMHGSEKFPNPDNIESGTYTSANFPALSPGVTLVIEDQTPLPTRLFNSFSLILKVGIASVAYILLIGLWPAVIVIIIISVIKMFQKSKPQNLQ